MKKRPGLVRLKKTVLISRPNRDGRRQRAPKPVADGFRFVVGIGKSVAASEAHAGADLTDAAVAKPPGASGVKTRLLPGELSLE